MEYIDVYNIDKGEKVPLWHSSPLPPTFLKGGGSGSMVQGQVFLKGGAGTFPIHFCQGLSFLHLEITLSFAKL